MRKFKLLSQVSCCAIVSLAVAFPALAQANEITAEQSAGSLSDDDSGAIVVTARRVEERLQDVPISITVFNQTQISNRNVVNAGDLATFTPSLVANGRFGAESTSFAIRGFNQEGPTSPSVAVYFADVVAPRANGGTTGGNGAGVGAFFDLQNVQILKGPQGTLFGRNTTGGAILLVPQKPTDDLEGYVEGSIGNYDLRRIQAVANVPLAENFRVRLGVDRNKRRGYLNNITDVGPKHFGDVNYSAFRLSIVGDLTPNLENYIIASYSVSDTNGFLPKPFILTNPNAYRAAEMSDQIAATSGDFYDVMNGSPDAGQRIAQWQVINTTTWQASDLVTFKNIVSYAEFRQRQTASIYGDYGFNPDNSSYDIAVSVHGAPGRHNISQSTFTEELQLQGRSADSRLIYQIGGYYERSLPLGIQAYYAPAFLNCTDVLALQCTDIRGRETPNGSGGNLEGRVGSSLISQTQYRYRNMGVYAQGTFNFTDQLAVTGGLRYTWDRSEGLGRPMRAFFFTPNVPSYVCANPTGIVVGGTSSEILADPSRCDIKRNASSNKPTWLLSLEYKPNRDALLYAKYVRGYRQGNVSVTQYGLETWGPEQVDTYEIGVKASFNGPIRGNVNIAAFYNDFKDQQLLIATVPCTTISLPQCPFVPGAASGIANAGSSTITGVEIEGMIEPFEGFNLQGAYTYLDTKINSITVPAVPPIGFTALFTAPAGGRIPFSPKHKLSITAGYILPLDRNIGEVVVSATYTYQAEMFGTLASRPTEQVLPAQNQLNLNLNWGDIVGKPIDLALFVTNVTKEEYRTFTTGSSFGFDALITNQPRMFGARLRYRFGD